MIARNLLQQAADRLATAGCDSPRLDAECLLAHAWRTDRTGLFIRLPDEVPEAVAEAFDALLARREKREPLAYVVGEKEFWSRDFAVTPATLIPRPETEHLIEEALKRLSDHDAPYRIVDIGTGSGCIAITLACELTHAHVVATDISKEALKVAGTNAARHAATDRMAFRQGDMFQALQPGDGPFDLIISNPPYVAEHEMAGLEAELAFEPRNALTDEADGLAFLSHILEGGIKWLKPNGWIIVETGTCGLPAIPQGVDLVEQIRDLAGHLRGGVYRLS